MVNETQQEEIQQEEVLQEEILQEEAAQEEAVHDKQPSEHEMLLDKYQRCLAEFDNFRKRTAKEKSSMYDDGVRDTIEELLPVFDNFERALNAPPPDGAENSFFKGIEMIFKQMQNALQAIGVEELSAIGHVFDHNIHNAVAHVIDEAYGEKEIIEELQKGYSYKGKVIRHSMVKVAN